MIGGIKKIVYALDERANPKKRPEKAGSSEITENTERNTNTAAIVSQLFVASRRKVGKNIQIPSFIGDVSVFRRLITATRLSRKTKARINLYIVILLIRDEKYRKIPAIGG